MRQYIIATAVAFGLIALWAAILPLAAEPSISPHAATSRTETMALFLCRGRTGLDRACVRALAKALALETKADAPTGASDQRCRVDHEVLAKLRRHD